MSGTSQWVYYWDACIYLAWIKEEPAYRVYLPTIGQIAAENFQLKNIIITSVLTFTEDTYATLTPEQIEKFNKSFRPESHIPYDVDRAIADKARIFRERFMGQAKSLATPDAIHLATAVIGGANEFHTFDEGQKDKKHTGLITISGDARIERLKICKPALPQATLNPTAPAATQLPLPQSPPLLPPAESNS
jgi:predicted nucleic acid-binding protein